MKRLPLAIALLFVLIGFATMSPAYAQVSGGKKTDQEFMQWARENLAVTDIAINSSTLFVTLTPDKYTSKANVEQIAKTIARYYCIQTQSSAAICRVFSGKQLYAKGMYINRK